MNRILLILIFLSFYGVSAFAKEWRGIVPLHSTRSDVERLLGPPSIDHGDTVVYEYDDERSSIEYSKGACNSNVDVWNVPANTVVNIWVSPRHLYLDELKLDLTQYEKRQDRELLYIYNYTDRKQGVRYQIDERRSKMIVLIEYFHAATDSRLRCPSKRSNSIRNKARQRKKN